MKLKKIISQCVFGILLLITELAMAQYPVKIHSHNDYTRTIPFYEAYSQKIYSIEIDLFYRNGKFYVSHDEADIDKQKTFDALYLDPLIALYRMNKGRVWADADRPLQLVIEIKSNDTNTFMNALVDIFKLYPEVFNPEKNPNSVRIVITGKVPSADKFSLYPSYIGFDGDLNDKYTSEELKQIAMFSLDFGSLSHWNGKGSLMQDDKKKVTLAINRAHAQGKPIRFWGAPDGITAWETFYWMGVDYINTDHVEQCAEFFNDWENKNYVISANKKTVETGVTNTDRLDKTTHNFSGFKNDKLQLAQSVATYTPSYRNDGADLPVKNVILLIGDGMGLGQITAADRVNKGLSMLNMRYMGLITTSALDAFTTDSAASGSALSCGHLVSNRHICMSDDGKPYSLITDFFVDKGKACGVVTLGNVADATPAVFYGHNVERDNSDALTRDLLDGKLTLLAGSGMDVFTHRHDGVNLIEQLKEKEYSFVTSFKDINTKVGKEICIDEEMGKAAEVGNLDLLARTTHNAIQKLDQSSSKGFFLMVEGAKIDYAGHSRCLPGSIMETLSFDMAVAEVLKFADQNGETLVIVTADHETGGLTLIDGDNETGRVTAYYVTNDHTPIMIPVLVYGPQAQKFIGKYYHYEIPSKIKTLFP
ncbi:MAG: Alkaline phosphatase [Bacteroidetes bacterium]|nr:Alkaline phosphatase [Bacteroidota bacterium]